MGFGWQKVGNLFDCPARHTWIEISLVQIVITYLHKKRLLCLIIRHSNPPDLHGSLPSFGVFPLSYDFRQNLTIFVTVRK